MWMHEPAQTLGPEPPPAAGLRGLVAVVQHFSIFTITFWSRCRLIKWWWWIYCYFIVHDCAVVNWALLCERWINRIIAAIDWRCFLRSQLLQCAAYTYDFRVFVDWVQHSDWFTTDTNCLFNFVKQVLMINKSALSAPLFIELSRYQTPKTFTQATEAIRRFPWMT